MNDRLATITMIAEDMAKEYTNAARQANIYSHMRADECDSAQKIMLRTAENNFHSIADDILRRLDRFSTSCGVTLDITIDEYEMTVTGVYRA